MIPKVMVGTVTYKGKDYCRGEFVKRRDELDGDIIEEVWTDDIDKRSVERITDGYNILLNRFLDSDCTHLLTLEADIIPPSHIIKQLLGYDLPVVGALYMIGPVKNRHPCAYFKGRKRRRDAYGNELVPTVNHIGLNEIDGTLQEIEGCGLGCVLIKREILENYKFRFEQAHCDTYFHLDTLKKGIKTYVDTSIVCKHHGSWEEWLKVMKEIGF